MKNPLETARRWLAEAEFNLSTAQLLLDNGVWSQACFHAEQTARLTLKAFLYLRGRRFINIHSIRALAQECGREDADFLKLQDYGIILDRYYLATRYPDALPAPAVPFESFTEGEARKAVGFAGEMVDLVRSRVSAGDQG